MNHTEPKKEFKPNSCEIEQTQKAVIYCRVSSRKQLSEGDGIASQETRCRDHARRAGYDVIESFAEKGVSGGVLDRPQMRKLISCLLNHPDEEIIVIIDDLNRFSRDIEVHWQLRRLISNAGGILETPSMRFGETSHEKLVENLIASVSQHQREHNGEQVVHRMKARVMNGYYVLPAPAGYKYQKTKEHGKLLMRHEPMASFLQEALEGYASGRLGSQAEVLRFLSSKPVTFPKNRHGEIHPSRVREILTHPVYAGLVQATCWDIPKRAGHHEGLISVATYEKIQKRLELGSNAPARKDIAEDFPLRGFVVCADCETPLRSCWSKGKTKKHPYYLCQTKDCVSYGKSIRRASIESEFETLLKQMRPTASLFKLIKAMVFDAFDQRKSHTQADKKTMKRNLLQIDNQIEKLADTLIETNSMATRRALERRMEKLEQDKLLIDAKLQERTQKTPDPVGLLELPLRFLSNPWKLWASGDIHLRRLVLRLAFLDQLPYSRSEGNRTPKTTLPFNMLGDFCMQNLKMVEPRGIEPLTSSLPAKRSPS